MSLSSAPVPPDSPRRSSPRRARAPAAVRPAARRRQTARRENPRQRRLALQRDERGRVGRRLLGRPPDDHPPDSPRVSGPRHRRVLSATSASACTKKRTASCFPTASRRGTCCARSSTKRSGAAPCSPPARASSTSSATATASALTTARGDVHAGRVVLATGGQSLPKSGSDGAGYEMARRLGHTIVPTTPALVPLLLAGGDGSDARGAERRRAPGRADAAGGRRRGGAPDGVAPLDALRHQRARDAGHVAPLAARPSSRAASASLTANFCPGRTFDADRRMVDGRAPADGRRPRSS